MWAEGPRDGTQEKEVSPRRQKVAALRGGGGEGKRENRDFQAVEVGPTSSGVPDFRRGSGQAKGQGFSSLMERPIAVI